MDHDDVLALFDDRIRRNAAPGDPGVRVERDGAVVRQVGGEDSWNGVVWSGLDEAGADAAIAAQVRHFAALGLEFEWKAYSHDRPADLGERLLAAGFTAEPAEALMIARIEDLPTDVVLPEGVRLQPVTDEAGVDLLMEAHEQAFGRELPRLRERILDHLRHGPDTVSMVVAMAGDRPISGARMELNPGTGFAGLWGGGTAPDWRGRGIYRALVAHRARLAADLGYQYLQVDASDQSRPILQRLGFAWVSTTTPYLRGPA
ncbi:ribosomal protein S18 acetylase RimI-like enzyme [Streptomyces sp. 1114.5]|uniref:GNAT family N-acetyltransferase n=1 Tax=Streptomyces sp. 1114.5 TaxID=1938830 RepID=UPI000EB13B86|nr:GNAT family N-acetyltransferase [Streptomyces sp. 1114.5]RKT11527.1 ribosomal protein S18 acetylase RimI-like enzyme [Streptomyces sp. 1114.5]